MVDYRVFSMSSGEEDDSTEAHVFARAYRWAWRSMYGSEPVGRHQIASLELEMDFGVPVLAPRAAHVDAASNSRCAESAPDAVYVPPGAKHDY